MSHRLVAYQIEVLAFKKRRNGNHSDVVVPDTNGKYKCPRCGWEGKWQNSCPKCDYTAIRPKNMIKVVDMMGVAPRETHVRLFYNQERAKKWGERFGTVISCHKVDTSRYLENINYLNLKQEPIEIELEREDFILNKALELERPRRRFGGSELSIEISEEGIDKK